MLHPTGPPTQAPPEPTVLMHLSEPVPDTVVEVRAVVNDVIAIISMLFVLKTVKITIWPLAPADASVLLRRCLELCRTGA